MCSQHRTFAALLYSMAMAQTGHTLAAERCCPDDLTELIRRRGCGLMFFLLLMSWLMSPRLERKEGFLCGEPR
uniref:Secreted protein n=1 Tax=Arundo donax TaxID=35708 RepID=A0A0A8XNI3_ARUDO